MSDCKYFTCSQNRDIVGSKFRTAAELNDDENHPNVDQASSTAEEREGASFEGGKSLF